LKYVFNPWDELYPFILKPKHLKYFSEEVMDVEYMNRHYLIYALQSRILIYKGAMNGELFHSIPVVSPLYSYCLWQNYQEIFKMVA